MARVSDRRDADRVGRVSASAGGVVAIVGVGCRVERPGVNDREEAHPTRAQAAAPCPGQSCGGRCVRRAAKGSGRASPGNQVEMLRERVTGDRGGGCRAAVRLTRKGLGEIIRER